MGTGVDLGFKPELTIAFSTKDRKAAAAWYAAHLGFEILFDAEEMGWCELATSMSGVTLGLGETFEVKPGNCVPVFAVADLDAARAALEAKGVRFDGPTEVNEGYVKLATFYDGDGNALMLSQMLDG